MALLWTATAGGGRGGGAVPNASVYLYVQKSLSLLQATESQSCGGPPAFSCITDVCSRDNCYYFGGCPATVVTRLRRMGYRGFLWRSESSSIVRLYHDNVTTTHPNPVLIIKAPIP